MVTLSPLLEKQGAGIWTFDRSVAIMIDICTNSIGGCHHGDVIMEDVIRLLETGRDKFRF